MGQEVPLSISVAPFPEGFQGDMDEHAQQFVQLMEASIQGNFLTGLVLPPGSTLPTTDQGPIAMGNVWYFWDPTTNQYLPQTVSSKLAKNFAKNSCYQVQQTGSAITPGVGVTPAFDMSACRSTLGNVLAISADTGPPASTDTDYIPSAIKYTVGPALVPTAGATDLYAHEHLFEGSDIAMLQGEVLTLSFSVWVNVPGNYSVYLTSGGRDCSYVSTFAVAAGSVWQRVKVIGIPAIPVGTGTWNFGEGQTGLYVGIPMLLGAQWQAAKTNTWENAFLAGTSGNTNLLTVVNNQIKITGIKLEAAPVASFLSVPAFSADLEELQRYYFTSFLYQSTTNGTPINLVANQSGSWAGAYIFPRRMAKAPLVVPYSYQTQAAGLITDISTNPPFDIPVASLPATRRGVAGTGVSTINTTGNLNATTSITGIPSTAGISAGAVVTGAGIPTGTTVVTIVSPTSVALSAAATTTQNGVALKFNNLSTFTTTGTTNSYSTTGTTDGSTTSITAIPSTASILVGMPVSGTGIPAGATVTSVAATSITISLPTTAAGTGVALVFGTQSITAIPSTGQMAVGMPISGNGVPAGSTIKLINSTTAITISNFLTAFGTGVSLTVGLFNKGDVFWAMICADARLS
jgi:hypothetical protein